MDSPRSETAPPPAVDLSRWFTDEVQPHEAPLKAYLRGAYPAVRDVEDVVQESFLRVWRTRARQSVRSAKALLFHVARGIVIDSARRESVSPIAARVEPGDVQAVVDPAPSAAEVACSAEEYALLADAIRALPSRCREIVIMRKLQRLSQKEIAARLGISEQTVQVQVLNGVRRCGVYLARRGVGGNP